MVAACRGRGGSTYRGGSTELRAAKGDGGVFLSRRPPVGQQRQEEFREGATVVVWLRGGGWRDRQGAWKKGRRCETREHREEEQFKATRQREGNSRGDLLLGLESRSGLVWDSPSWSRPLGSWRTARWSLGGPSRRKSSSSCKTSEQKTGSARHPQRFKDTKSHFHTQCDDVTTLNNIT